MDGCGIYHKIGTVFDVIGTLTVGNLCTAAGQKISKGRLLGIGTGYGKMSCQQDLCQSAHADAADTDEMDVNGFLKIYLIHNKNLLIKCDFLLLYTFLQQMGSISSAAI